MSIGIFKEYGPRAESDSIYYPEGTFKNESAPGMYNGTPVERKWARNVDAYFQKLRKRAGVVNNDDVDNVVFNQTWQAFLSALSQTAQPTALPADICAGMPDIDWSNPCASPNYLDTSETIRDACVGWDAEYGKPCLFILYGTVTVAKVVGPWSYGGSPLESALSFSWGTTPDDVLAICCDADYLYVAWKVDSGNVKLSKFAINPWTGTEVLTVRDTGYQGYPASGVVSPAAALCVADDDNIGVLIHEWQGGADHRIRMGVWAKDNGSWSSSAFSSHDADFNCGTIVSDGTYLYTIGRDESGAPTYVYDLLRITIAAPATQGEYEIASLSSSSYHTFPTSIQRVRDMIIMTNMQGRLWAHQIGSSDVDIMFGDLSFNYYDTGSQYGSIMGSDGKNLHMHHIVDGASEYHCVFRVPHHEFAIEAIESPVIDVSHVTAQRIKAASSIPQYYTMGRLLFDRRDIWLVCYTGEIFRICNPAGS